MYEKRNRIVIAALIVVLAAVSPTLLAQNKHPKDPTSRNTDSKTAEGKILWQYNTDGLSLRATHGRGRHSVHRLVCWNLLCAGSTDGKGELEL